PCSPMADWPPQRILALLSAPPHPGSTIAKSLASLRNLHPRHRSTRRSEPCPVDRGSRKAKHGCFARESGQDVLTERKALPGRQGAASIRSPGTQAVVRTFCLDWERPKKKAGRSLPFSETRSLQAYSADTPSPSS